MIPPKEMPAHLRTRTGDEPYALETPDGIRRATCDATFAAKMEAAEKVMQKNRDLLHRLARAAES